jgi:two-component system, OmpR family, copper resistance phosphate regulon response regulator CusR
VRILIVEDERKVAGFLSKGLKEAGYVADMAESGSAAEAMTSQTDYDLIILDVMLPDQNGMDTARHLRRDGHQGPILMLTALGTTQDKVRGLDAGADDYLTKPYSMEELLARVRALLRRPTSGRNQPIKLHYADLEMDLVQRKVLRRGQDIHLTAREFALLEYFLRNAGRPLTRTSIGEHVWDLHFDNESNVIDVYINMLRKKIDQPFGSRLLHTLIGVGYVLRQDP